MKILTGPVAGSHPPSAPATPTFPPLFLGIFGALLVLCYWPMLRMTGVLLVSSEDMAHGLFAPLVSLYLVWELREQILRPSARPSWWGVTALTLAALLGVSSVVASSSTFSRFAFLISLAGCALLVGGFNLLQRLSFPLFLLLFTFPVPEVLYGQITQPLQLLASSLSELAFESAGFGVMRDGNILQLAHMRLNVVEACSGLRSLITLTFFCIVYAYFMESRRWMRGVVVALAIPAAIFVNVLRITCTGVLGKYNPAWTKGTYHDMLGWSGFFVGFALVALCHWMLNKLIKPHAVPMAAQ